MRKLGRVAGWRTLIAALCLTIVFVASGSLVPSEARAEDGCTYDFSGGNGSEGLPYLISSRADLEHITSEGDCVMTDDYYLQTTDIDLSASPWTPPSGSPFGGHYDGGGHQLTGLTIVADVGASYVGLFPWSYNVATFRNLTIRGARVSSAGSDPANWVGVLVGYASQSTIDNVQIVDATVSTPTYQEVGLIVGYAYALNLTRSSASGSVSGATNVGGLVGEVCEGTITSSSSSAVVHAGSGVAGGVVGTVASVCDCALSDTVQGTSEIRGIFDSQATGSVDGVDDVGGLVGSAEGIPIERSYATGAVTGSGTAAGGLVGRASGLSYVDKAAGSITNSYARGSVTGNTFVGGLIGVSGGDELVQTYATGAVTGVAGTGGLVGSLGINSVVSTSSFWDTSTTGQSASSIGTGKSTAEMKSLTPFQTAEVPWAIVSGWEAPGTNTWGICTGANDGYPYLLRQFGSVSEACPVVAPVATVDAPVMVAKAPVPVTLAVLSTAGQGMSIVTRLRVSGAGSISQVGTFGGSKVVVCRQTKRAMRAGTVVLVCTVNAATQALLRTQRVKVVVVTTFTSKSGTVVRRHRTVVLPRIVSKPIAVTG